VHLSFFLKKLLFKESFVTLNHEVLRYVLYKQYSRSLAFSSLSLSLSLPLPLLLRIVKPLKLKSKFKAYLINRQCFRVAVCFCVPVLGMIRRERVRESYTMTEGIGFPRSLANLGRSGMSLLREREAGNPRRRGRETSR
jgi:hypothetical protein